MYLCYDYISTFALLFRNAWESYDWLSIYLKTQQARLTKFQEKVNKFHDQWAYKHIIRCIYC